MDYAIELLNITKEFPGIKANDDITMQVKEGSIHAILGENGAGKSTLMSILFGLYQPTSGKIKVRGKEVKISNPNVANKLRIGMVHQHFKLIQNFTVTENVILGIEPKSKFGTLDLVDAQKRVMEISTKYNFNIDPKAKIEDISVGMQQKVEILKMLYRDTDILIFDEPTAVLTPQEIRDLIKTMHRLVDEGKTILIITHKLKEIKAVADYCSVIKRGKMIGTVDVETTSIEEMAEMMVGREISFNIEKTEAKPQDIVLEINNLSYVNANKVKVLKDLSFNVRAGEIVGIAGIDGNGQTELVYAITGLISHYSGDIKLNGESIDKLGIRKRLEAGMSHIPEDRHKHGLILDFKLKENFVIHDYNTKRFSKNGIINEKAVDQYAIKLIEEFDVRSGQGKETITRSMSGGNQQKAIVAREIDRHQDLLVVVQPTRGLDVGAIEYIHSRIVEERDNGKAILLISLELDEVIDLSDRIVVVCNGEITGEVLAKDTDENALGLMMSGNKQSEVQN